MAAGVAVPWACPSTGPGREAARSVDAACVRSWLAEVAGSLEEERDFLTQLDAAIGDADHGVNMHRGFTAVMRRVDALEAATPGQLLKTTGRTFVSTVGGAAGPLYGTAFLQAGESLGDGDAFGPRRLLEALRASLEGVQRVGAASEGDKTMVDALAPALAAYQLEVRTGGSLETAVRAAGEAARTGTVHTARGELATPLFMPVGTRGAVKTLSTMLYLSANVRASFGRPLPMIHSFAPRASISVCA